MNKKPLPTLVLVAVALVFVAFTVFSTEVTIAHGFFGFLTLAGREPWGMQILLDLAISMTMVSCWLAADAKERDIPAWPYLLACLAVGSIGALAYLLHREIKVRGRVAERARA